MRRSFAAVAAIILLFFVVTAVYGAKPVFVTICHAAGQADEPANWVTLTLPEQAVYGQAGHFNENGTTQAGHEQDYMGACQVAATPTPTPVVETPTPTPVIEATPTPVPSVDETPVPSASETPVATPSASIDVPATVEATPSDVPNTGLPYMVDEGNNDMPFNLLAFLMITGSMGLMIWRAVEEQRQ